MAKANVLCDGERKNCVILSKNGCCLFDIFEFIFLDVPAIDENGSSADIIQSC